jgi:sugar lactone lactonase YvrE
MRTVLGSRVVRIVFLLSVASLVTVAEGLFSADDLFVAEPLTLPGQFTAGIEGPACDRDGNVYAVNFARQGTIGRVSAKGRAEVFVDLPEGSVGNGVRFDRDGAMYIADYTRHNVLRVDPKTRKVAVFAHEDGMNQPNDLAIAPDGTLFASDPDWGKSTGQVWRIDRDGKVTKVASDMGTTNGIEVSPDGRTLYVNESVQRKIWAFDIAKDGSLSKKRLLKRFEDHGVDGMRCDVFGNLYVTRYGKGTVVKLSPDGKVQREIDVLGARPSNICFGGPDGCTAYVTEVEHTRLVAFRVDQPGLAWNRWVQTKRTENLSELVERGGLPARVHVFEDFETEIEKRWWLRGTPEARDLSPSRSASVPNRRAMRAAESRDFDRKMGDRSRTYRAVVFNPVPGPPMGERTRLSFRYRLDGTDEIRVQIFSLSRGFHRYLTLRGLEQGAWSDACVDMTAARRPDGSGGPLAKDERIDDIQFYIDPTASLVIDDIVLFDAVGATSNEGAAKRSLFPRRVIFTGWFDTGKQGKEWPGDFEIVLHDEPRTWDYAKSVPNPATGTPWIRVDFRGERPLGARTRVRFSYRSLGDSELRVELARRRGNDVTIVAATPIAAHKSDGWVAVDFELVTPSPQETDGPAVANELRVRLEKGRELRLDDLLIYEN